MSIPSRTVLLLQDIFNDSSAQTHLKRLMSVPNVVKPVNLAFVGKHGNRDRMNRSIAPSFVVETSSTIQVVKEIIVSFGTEEAKISFEVSFASCATMYRFRNLTKLGFSGATWI